MTTPADRRMIVRYLALGAALLALGVWIGSTRAARVHEARAANSRLMTTIHPGDGDPADLSDLTLAERYQVLREKHKMVAASLRTAVETLTNGQAKFNEAVGRAERAEAEAARLLALLNAPAGSVQVAPPPSPVLPARVVRVLTTASPEGETAARVARMFGHSYTVDGVSLVAQAWVRPVVEARIPLPEAAHQATGVAVVVGDAVYIVEVEADDDLIPFAESRAAAVVVRHRQGAGPGPRPAALPDGTPIE